MKNNDRRLPTADCRERDVVRRLQSAVGLTVLVVTLLVAPASAQGGITASSAKVDSKFADHITYSIALQSDSDIATATVFVRYNTGDRSSNATTRGKAEFAPGKNVTVSFNRKLTRGELLPGTDIEYYWQVENVAGQTLKTDTFKYVFPDDRFDFQSVSGPVGKGKVTLFWYGAAESYGRERLRVAIAAIERLQKQIGVELQTEAKIFVYRTREDMQVALPSKGQTADSQLTVLGELAGPTTVLLLGGDSNVNNTTAHELSHLVVHLATTNPLIGGVSIPAWLDEGLSMYNQDTVERGYTDALDRAIRNDRLISLRSLSAVPGQPDQVILFYGQAYSVVKYLNETYSKDKMLKLLAVFKRGAVVEDALKEVYGFGVQELDDKWRASLGASAPAAQATVPASSATQNTPAPQSPPAPSSAPFSCACLSSLGFVFLWWFIRRGNSSA